MPNLQIPQLCVITDKLKSVLLTPLIQNVMSPKLPSQSSSSSGNEAKKLTKILPDTFEEHQNSIEHGWMTSSPGLRIKLA